MALEIELFSDPACPVAFSAEPVRQRLRWHYGDGLRWTPRMIVLTREPGHAERLAEGAPNLQRRYGMPIAPVPYERPASSEPASLAVVATRLNAPAHAERLLRRLRVLVMQSRLLDDPELIAQAAGEAGLDPAELDAWCAEEDSKQALEDDVAAARTPLPAALALDHKLGGPRSERRYTAPSYVFDRRFVVPGLNPVEAYEAAIANLAPELRRRPRPTRVEQVLEWAAEPLATAEVALLIERDIEATRTLLARAGRFEPAGADGYWTL